MLRDKFDATRILVFFVNHMMKREKLEYLITARIVEDWETVRKDFGWIKKVALYRMSDEGSRCVEGHLTTLKSSASD